mgnify:CR=1 FL=1
MSRRGDDKDKPNVKEILKKADDATKAVTEISCDAEFHGEGEVAQRVPKVRGKVMAKKAKTGLIGSMVGGAANSVRFEGKFQPPGMDEDTAFESATDGKMFTPSIAVKNIHPGQVSRSPGAASCGIGPADAGIRPPYALLG